MNNNDPKEMQIKCGYNCAYCLCVKKHYNGGNIKPEDCKKEKKKAD